MHHMAPPLRLKRSDYEHSNYFELIAPGTSLQEALSPAYWVHVNRGMRVHDVIELVAADGSFDCLVRIVHIDKHSGALAFRILNHVGEGKPAGVEAARESDFELRHTGHGRWSVVERSTGNTLLENVSKQKAEAFANAPGKAA